MENDKDTKKPSSSDIGMWKDEEGQFEFAVALVESIKECSDQNTMPIWKKVKKYAFYAIIGIMLFFVCMC